VSGPGVVIDDTIVDLNARGVRPTEHRERNPGSRGARARPRWKPPWSTPARDALLSARHPGAAGASTEVLRHRPELLSTTPKRANREPTEFSDGPSPRWSNSVTGPFNDVELPPGLRAARLRGRAWLWSSASAAAMSQLSRRRVVVGGYTINNDFTIRDWQRKNPAVDAG